MPFAQIRLKLPVFYQFSSILLARRLRWLPQVRSLHIRRVGWEMARLPREKEVDETPEGARLLLEYSSLLPCTEEACYRAKREDAGTTRMRRLDSSPAGKRVFSHPTPSTLKRNEPIVISNSSLPHYAPIA